MAGRRFKGWWLTQAPLSLFILIQTVIWSIISLLLFLVDSSGRATHRFGARPWAKILLWACRVRLEVEGTERLRADGRAQVLVPNHQSLFDILALLAGLPVDFKFVVKKEIIDIPLWGHAMRRAGYIAIDRDSTGNAKALMAEAAQKIRRGSSVLFFAEGTRSEDGRLLPFRRGAFILAAQSGGEVAPIVIQGSGEVLSKKSWRIRPGLIKITVLPPLSDPALTGNSKKLMAEVRRRMLQVLGQVEESAGDPPAPSIPADQATVPPAEPERDVSLPAD